METVQDQVPVRIDVGHAAHVRKTDRNLFHRMGNAGHCDHAIAYACIPARIEVPVGTQFQRGEEREVILLRIDVEQCAGRGITGTDNADTVAMTPLRLETVDRWEM